MSIFQYFVSFLKDVVGLVEVLQVCDKRFNDNGGAVD